MPKIYLSMGSNLDKEIHIPSGLWRLQQHFGPLTASGIYESEPVGYDGPLFHNLVVGLVCDLEPEAIASLLGAVETLEGRERTPGKKSPHTLDIDLLLYGDAVFERGRLKIPRDDITRYAFVLEPLAELAPGEKHPVLGISYAQLWADFDRTPLRQRRVGDIPQP